VASAAPQAAVQPYTGQIREIKIDQCGLEPGTCERSLVLAQAVNNAGDSSAAQARGVELPQQGVAGSPNRGDGRFLCP
jgi:hypothetical protein